MSNVLITETTDFVTPVTMHRPNNLNALSVELRQRLGETFVQLKSDAATKVIVLTGNGRAFTADLDLKELG